MVGRLEYGKGKVHRGELYGLPVLCAKTDPDGWFSAHRLGRVGRSLLRQGVRRVLAPPGFGEWALLEGVGLRQVATGPFLRAQSAALTLAALERQGTAPDRATVALRGSRADGEMLRAAVALCPTVRRLVIDAPRGGAELAHRLRWEFGIPILPAAEVGEVGLSFGEGCGREQEKTLCLYGLRPRLDGVWVEAPDLAEKDQNDLPLLAILWENGRLDPQRLKIT